MKFKKEPSSTLFWFILSLIPILNLYWAWKVSKVLANVGTERGD